MHLFFVRHWDHHLLAILPSIHILCFSAGLNSLRDYYTLFYHTPPQCILLDSSVTFVHFCTIHWPSITSHSFRNCACVFINWLNHNRYIGRWTICLTNEYALFNLFHKFHSDIDELFDMNCRSPFEMSLFAWHLIGGAFLDIDTTHKSKKKKIEFLSSLIPF